MKLLLLLLLLLMMMMMILLQLILVLLILLLLLQRRFQQLSLRLGVLGPHGRLERQAAELRDLRRPRYGAVESTLHARRYTTTLL